MLIQNLRDQLFAERINGKIMRSGCKIKKLREDARDIRYKHLGGLFGGYEPKHTTHIIPTLSTKLQHQNTCTQESATLQAEPDEGVELGEQSLTIFATERGVISGNGYSSLDAIQTVVQKDGIAEKRFIDGDDSNWVTYTNNKALSLEARENAKIHKSKTRVYINSRDEAFKALDDGHIIQDGIDWFSGYNMGGGLSAPWILTPRSGLLVGGHAFCRIGYDRKYLGVHEVFICKNSYGTGWGDRRKFIMPDGREVIEQGIFYVLVSHWYGAMLRSPVGIVRVDMDPGQQEALKKQYEGKQVKSATSNSVFYIENGIARAFPDKTTYYAFGGRFGVAHTWVPIADSVLRLFPIGPLMDITQSSAWPLLRGNWDLIKTLQDPKNFEMIDRLVRTQSAQNLNGTVNTLIDKFKSFFKL